MNLRRNLRSSQGETPRRNQPIRARAGRRPAGAVVMAAAVGVLVAGCVSAPAVTETAATVEPSPTPSAAASPAPSATVPAAECDDATVSFDPRKTSAYADQIKKRGYLLVGVSADTRLLGAVDPNDPDTFEGFDIDMARFVAQGIFDDPDKIRFKVITTADRIGQLQNSVNEQNNASGGVDLVARAFTMNCSRWNDIAFSAVYLNAGQRLMVPTGSEIKSVEDLSGLKVCAPRGSTSLKNITELTPGAEAVGVASHTDCIVALQQGRVDAITGDDAILAGFSDQDPGTEVVGDQLSEEPYGLGVSADHKDFAAFVNSVLDDARADGSWQRSYDTWLKAALGERTPPKPLYGRT